MVFQDGKNHKNHHWHLPRHGSRRRAAGRIKSWPKWQEGHQCSTRELIIMSPTGTLSKQGDSGPFVFDNLGKRLTIRRADRKHQIWRGESGDASRTDEGFIFHGKHGDARESTPKWFNTGLVDGRSLEINQGEYWRRNLFQSQAIIYW